MAPSCRQPAPHLRSECGRPAWIDPILRAPTVLCAGCCCCGTHHLAGPVSWRPHQHLGASLVGKRTKGPTQACADGSPRSVAAVGGVTTLRRAPLPTGPATLQGPKHRPGPSRLSVPSFSHGRVRQVSQLVVARLRRTFSVPVASSRHGWPGPPQPLCDEATRVSHFAAVVVCWIGWIALLLSPPWTQR
mgnify:CR=1 FL=1